MATKTKKKDADAEEESGGKGKMLKIVGGVVAAAVAYKFLLAPAPPAPAEPAAEPAAAEEAVIEEGDVVPIPELVLNLADAESHFLRVGIALVLEKGTSGDAIATELPIASDVAVDVLSAKTFDELREPGAKAKVKAELSEKVREAFDDAKVARVIFTSFVMQ